MSVRIALRTYTSAARQTDVLQQFTAAASCQSSVELEASQRGYSTHFQVLHAFIAFIGTHSNLINQFSCLLGSRLMTINTLEISYLC